MKSVLPVVLFSLLILPQAVKAQDVELEAKIDVVDSLIRSRGFHETELRIRITNNVQHDIFIPNMLSEFKSQVRDSLEIYRLENGIYKLIGATSGSRNTGLRHVTVTERFLGGDYFEVFLKKKRFGDSVIKTVKRPSGERSANPLFLSKGEEFTLYRITSPDYFFPSSGNYKLVFKLNGKLRANLPDELAGFKMYSFHSIKVEPIFVDVKKTRSGFKLLFRSIGNKAVKTKSRTW
ncbi:MAG TPA: hypothetical protein VF679_06895 [Pedobacter sp.]|jgi:hypothetical protein